MCTSSSFPNHSGEWRTGSFPKSIPKLIPLHSNKTASLRAMMMTKINRINDMALGDVRPEKAGVGGSIPSLATTF
jgi:hypothetical protein